MSSTTAQREFKCYQNENFKFKNTSLFTSLKVKKIKGAVISIIINGITFSSTKDTNKYIIFDTTDIRNHCREVLGLTEEENNYIRLEQTFMYNSLNALSHYKNISLDILDNAIFSEDLEIRFIVEIKNPPLTIEVCETYIVSDIHRDTYQN
uniref:Uncharacterized protein n=1 Tax=viral metagenome TaxID=1070528 RepID=A0A6C0HDV6_9ZZZZ